MANSFADNHTSNTPNTGSVYLPQLDGIRAIAVFMVVYSHWVHVEYHYDIRFGPYGVLLFFLLSGYLITGILLRCRLTNDKWFSLRAFYARRFLRIFPLYYAVLLGACLLNVAQAKEGILWHLAYLTNFYFIFRQEWGGAISHFWSLAVEEQFYLFWPFVIIFINTRFLLLSITLLLLVGLGSQLTIPYLFSDRYVLLNLLPNMNFDALGIGSLLAYLHYKGRTIRFLNHMTIASAIYMATISITKWALFGALATDYISRLSFLIISMWIIHVTASNSSNMLSSALSFRPLVYIGRISYGIYILHNLAIIPVGILTRVLGFSFLHSEVAVFIMKSIITLIGACLSWHFFETPFNSLKSRFPYQRKLQAMCPKDS
jgi:peptidoglycan/LPS O-acetylase OafA/YrhL